MGFVENFQIINYTIGTNAIPSISPHSVNNSNNIATNYVIGGSLTNFVLNSQWLRVAVYQNSSMSLILPANYNSSLVRFSWGRNNTIPQTEVLDVELRVLDSHQTSSSIVVSTNRAYISYFARMYC